VIVGYGNQAIQGAGKAVSIVHKRVRKIVRQPSEVHQGEEQEVIEEDFVQIGHKDTLPDDSYEVVNIQGIDGSQKSILVAKETETVEIGPIRKEVTEAEEQEVKATGEFIITETESKDDEGDAAGDQSRPLISS